MTKSTTKYHATQTTIQQRIDRLLDFTPKVKIRKLENGAVQVNNLFIKNIYEQWQCEDTCFFRRKSAVGYALCLIKHDYSKAKSIKDLDQKLQKVKTDIDFYHYHLRKNNEIRKNIMSHRISAEMPVLHQVDSQLTQLLKTISV